MQQSPPTQQPFHCHPPQLHKITPQIALLLPISTHLCHRLELSWDPGPSRRQWDGRAVPRPCSAPAWDWVGWQSSLGRPGPWNVLHKKKTVLSCQTGEISNLKAEITFSHSFHMACASECGRKYFWPVFNFWEVRDCRLCTQLPTVRLLLWASPQKQHNLMAARCKAGRT